MKTLTSLALRNHLGEVLDGVRVTGEPVVVIRHKRPIVQIIPYHTRRFQQRKNPDPAKKIIRKWPSRFRKIPLSPDLVASIGQGESVSLKEEKGRIARHLSSRV